MPEQLPKTTVEWTEAEHSEKAAAERAKDPCFYLTIRFMAAFYTCRKLPAGLTLEQALEITAKEARSKGLQCCLNTPQSRNYFLDAKGELEQITIGPRPHMVVSGNAFRLGEEDDPRSGEGI